MVCVAGNSIETPRLLLNSASSKFPDGLANSSGQVGRNYMRHTTGSVYAIFDQPVRMYRGTTMAGIIQDEARHDPSRGFVGGYELETLSLGLPFMAAFLDPGAWGRDFASAMESYDQHGRHVDRRRGHAAGENGVTLHPEREGRASGCRSRTCTSTTTPTTSRCATTPTRPGQAVYEAVGATRVFETAALSVDPQPRHLPAEREGARTASATSSARPTTSPNLFISDGSQFTTGAAENPTLTIVTLAIRQADHIADQMSKGEI